MPNKIDQTAENLRKAMENADDWEKKKTTIPGIFIVKMPEKNLRVMLMFNPPDEGGNPTKKRGFFFDDATTVEAARQAFPNKGLDALVEAVARINKKSGSKPGDDGDVFVV